MTDNTGRNYLRTQSTIKPYLHGTYAMYSIDYGEFIKNDRGVVITAKTPEELEIKCKDIWTEELPDKPADQTGAHKLLITYALLGHLYQEMFEKK